MTLPSGPTIWSCTAPRGAAASAKEIVARGRCDQRYVGRGANSCVAVGLGVLNCSSGVMSSSTYMPRPYVDTATSWNCF